MFRRTSCTSCEGLLMRRTSVPSAGISASSSRDRNADLWIRNPRVTPLRDADLWIRRPARAVRQSQDADLWTRHLARRERVPSLLSEPQPEASDTANLRKSIDEAEQQQFRRRVEANESVEVDLRVNTAKVHVEQQEALLRQTSSNPWFLFNEGEQDLLRLRGRHAWSPGWTCQSAYELSLEMSVPRNGCSTPSAAIQCTLLFACF